MSQSENVVKLIDRSVLQRWFQLASGCIVGECFICGDNVFEDEASWYNEKWKHTYCKTKRDLKQENEALKRELKEFRKWIKGTSLVD